ncbi:hypothetical protein [Mycolicibacterium rhodesiae]|uniref:PAS domain S-box/diguanylate cyclase (GGDEF) domain-containing protein n=1 Tax=Mycolicibacterium rhodesiae TaxID=36814 RepID=A0A1X0J241_MYCRH|nr:hypothetical protein [Mycolicibacterium rhodesiae]MCV7344617.1 hypothetical protein [Mycolicibacterium rhodesiae]ORB55901.1 hypothetical protein BST42_05740 [Mycolicibacterium rhodesiae]
MTDPVDFPEEGGPGDTLSGSESLDSDEVRNNDGDDVVDPPEGWSGATKFGITAREEREGESLDARLSEEEPDVIADIEPDETAPDRAHRGQTSGTPEDGEPIYPVAD